MPAYVIANIALEPGGIIAWVLVGLVAGALASRVVEGRGMGCLGDIIVGVVGAFLGSFVLGLILPGSATFELLGSIVVAFIGSVIFLLIIRLVTGRRG
ncbi:MAG: hypothetical protein QOE92_1504 [Chloroflexota bacterium]|jgi:uncharacterized membrane protein YeaQ/YmgE (transglycosylase-associated protein family)|nr:hypothetical protein [Chloroflexota bacterium]